MNDTVRRGVGYGLPLAWMTVLVALFDHLGPVARFLGATVGLLAAVKVGAWVLVPARSREYTLSSLQTLLYWTVWPGVRPDLFGRENDPERRAPDGRNFVAGTPVALGLCAFVAVFWSARILVDARYFSHDDWPEGVEYVVGHALLTSLFLLLVLIYAGTVAFHLA